MIVLPVLISVRPIILADEVWDEGHITGALHRQREGTLLLGGETIALWRIHLALRVQKLAQEIGVFVVEVGELLAHGCFHKFLLNNEL